MKSKKLAIGALALATTVSGFFAGFAYAKQPHMENAIVHLQNAKSELLAATDNKGGHKAKAVELIEQAAAAVRKGIDEAR